MEELPKTMTTAEMADLLCLSRERVRQLAHQGILIQSGHGKFLLLESCQSFFHHMRTKIFGEEAASIYRDCVADCEELKAKVASLEAELIEARKSAQRNA